MFDFLEYKIDYDAHSTICCEVHKKLSVCYCNALKGIMAYGGGESMCLLGTRLWQHEFVLVFRSLWLQ